MPENVRISNADPLRWESARAQGWKVNDFADRGSAQQEHEEAVKAQAETARGRHGVGERLEKVLVGKRGFGVACRARLGLPLESVALLFGIVELAIAGGQLHPRDDEIGMLGKVPDAAMVLRERRDVLGKPRDEGRLNERFLGDGLKDRRELFPRGPFGGSLTSRLCAADASPS